MAKLHQGRSGGTVSAISFLQKLLLLLFMVNVSQRIWCNILLLEQVSDVVPVACRAAADAGIRSVCVSNFRYSFVVNTVKFLG